MTLRKILESVAVELDAVDNALDEAVRHVGDVPEPFSLADRIDEEMHDLRSALNEAALVVRSVLGPSERPLDPAATRAGLGACGQLVLEASEQLNDSLRAERLHDLLSAGRRGPEWRGWGRTVREDLERVRAASDRLQRALLDAWQDVAERAASAGLSVQATNIGQQVTVPADQATHGGVT